MKRARFHLYFLSDFFCCNLVQNVRCDAQTAIHCVSPRIALQCLQQHHLVWLKCAFPTISTTGKTTKNDSFSLCFSYHSFLFLHSRSILWPLIYQKKPRITHLANRAESNDLIGKLLAVFIAQIFEFEGLLANWTWKLKRKYGIVRISIFLNYYREKKKKGIGKKYRSRVRLTFLSSRVYVSHILRRQVQCTMWQEMFMVRCNGAKIPRKDLLVTNKHKIKQRFL